MNIDKLISVYAEACYERCGQEDAYEALVKRDDILVQALNDIALSDNLYASLVAMTALQSIGEWG